MGYGGEASGSRLKGTQGSPTRFEGRTYDSMTHDLCMGEGEIGELLLMA